jgi:hypothetical protein
MESAQTERKVQIFDDYITAMKDRMKRDGQIKIYQEVLDQLQEESPDIEVPTRPRPPTGQ